MTRRKLRCSAADAVTLTGHCHSLRNNGPDRPRRPRRTRRWRTLRPGGAAVSGRPIHAPRSCAFPDGPRGTAAGAHKAFQTSIMVAAVRCTLMYLVFPFLLPAIGIAKGVGPAIGLIVNSAAIVCIVMSMRRFFRADHPKRWWYAGLGGSVLVLLGVLAVVDIADLLG